MKKLTKEIFISRATIVHNNLYDYSKVKFNNTVDKVCIICKKHGEFYQQVREHLRGQGCPKCNGGVNLTTEEFIEKAQKVHGNKYDYSKVDYKNNRTKVCIICEEHGEFLQSPDKHLLGQGCSYCSKRHNKDTEWWINDAKKIHGDKYDYSKVEYKNNKTKVCIICKEHGEFFQNAKSHLYGTGCPKCKSSRLEQEIRKLLDDNAILCEEQKKFAWLGLKSLDFYLLEYRIAIECQGEQHFKQTTFGNLNENVKRDYDKKMLCDKHGIRILYYSNLGIDYPYNVYENKEELLKEIVK